ncbi:MAG: ABC-type antimicrobial peptide transport system permease component [Bacteroidetes bacterium]|jgi:putative ABC transport system permease protein|nr:ABC-type antimicrobial peptide transport system permease component [Bacteroidota bacterium]
MSKLTLEWSNFRESLLMALAAIRTSKLRSVLTLLGVVVGVFSIIAVMTAVGVLRNSIEEGITQLGANTFQIQKFPVSIGDNHETRRKYRNRKDITYEQALQVKEKATLAEAVGIEVWRGGRVVFGNGQKTNPNVGVLGENLEGIITNDFTVETGRSFVPQDMDLAREVAILGKPVAEKLFPPHINPVGETVRVEGSLYQVIGVFQKKGGSLGGNQDNFVAIPLTTFFQKYGKADRSVQIMVKALNRDLLEDAIEQSRAILRVARKVPPGADDDFGYFSNDSLVNEFNEFTFYLRLGVLVVSSISLLAAGVGIMNIMLVSVTERTREIGIRKSVGAQKRDILYQFMIEAVILCEIGGVIGIVLGILGGNMVGVLLEVPAIIPWDWVVIGIAVCSVVGLVFGVYPAWKAANLDPIEALRFE